MENIDNKALVMFSCCVPVKGATRSVICDLQRKRYFFIPNSMFDFLNKYDGNSISTIKRQFYGEQASILEQYLNFLIENEICFFTNNPLRFPKISSEWKSPYLITNAIIDVGAKSTYSFDVVIDQLDKLGCAAIQLRFFDFFDRKAIEHILDLTKYSRIRNIELLAPYSSKLKCDNMNDLFNRNKRLTQIVLHSSPLDEKKFNVKNHTNLIYLSEEINSASHCGFISAIHFISDQNFYLEALKYNTCLHNKISIDINGEIKNCPALEKSYGNIAISTFEEALNDKSFKDIGMINKDNIEVCKDCEFRYMCTDCRAFVNNVKYGKPTKCGYDPYSATWSNNEDNPQSKHFYRLETKKV